MSSLMVVIIVQKRLDNSKELTGKHIYTQTIINEHGKVLLLNGPIMQRNTGMKMYFGQCTLLADNKVVL